MSLADVLRRLPGAVLVPSRSRVAFAFEVDGARMTASGRHHGALEVWLETAPLPLPLRLLAGRPAVLRNEVERQDGEASARWIGPGGALHHLEVEPAIDDALRDRLALAVEHGYQVEGEPAARQLWLDPPSRAALIDALWLTPSTPTSRGAPIAAAGFNFEVASSAVAVRAAGKAPVDRAVRAIVAGGVLARRPHRLAAELIGRYREIGGAAVGVRWSADGAFAVRFDRAPVEVTLDWRLDDHHGLRARLRAWRPIPSADRWFLVGAGLRDDDRPDLGGELWSVELPPELAGREARATAPTRVGGQLAALADRVVAAAPRAVFGTGDAIELWWPGIEVPVERLAAAVDLVARLAFEREAGGEPYR